MGTVESCRTKPIKRARRTFHEPGGCAETPRRSSPGIRQPAPILQNKANPPVSIMARLRNGSRHALRETGPLTESPIRSPLRPPPNEPNGPYPNSAKTKQAAGHRRGASTERTRCVFHNGPAHRKPAPFVASPSHQTNPTGRARIAKQSRCARQHHGAIANRSHYPSRDTGPSRKARSRSLFTLHEPKPA